MAALPPSPRTTTGFAFRATARGAVRISRDGGEVATPGGEAAAKFLARACGAPGEALRQLCTRATGITRRGNESAASKARRTKGGHG